MWGPTPIFLFFGASEHLPVFVVLDDFVRGGANFLTFLSHYADGPWTSADIYGWSADVHGRFGSVRGRFKDIRVNKVGIVSKNPIEDHKLASLWLNRP